MKKTSLLIFVLLITLSGIVMALQSEEQTQSKIIPLEITNPIKVVYQINTHKMKHKVNKGVHYLTYLMDHYKRLGIPKENITLVAVFYGDSIFSLLKDPHFKNRSGHGGRGHRNPNVSAIETLISNGVKVEACSESMRIKKIPHSELLPGIDIIEGSYVRVIDLQHQGYAYIKFL